MQSEYNANAHDLTKGDSLLAGFSRNSRLLFATGGLTLLFCTFCLILPLIMSARSRNLSKTIPVQLAPGNVADAIVDSLVLCLATLEFGPG